MEIEGQWDQIYVRPLDRGVILGDPENPGSQYFEDWIREAVYKGKLTFGGCTLQKVRITIEYEDATAT